MFLNYFQKIMYRSLWDTLVGETEILNYFPGNCGYKVIINFSKRSQKHRNTCQWCLMKNWWCFFSPIFKGLFQTLVPVFFPKTKINKYYEYCFQWGTRCSDPYYYFKFISNPIRNICTITYLRKLEYELTFMVQTGSRTYIRNETSSDPKRVCARF